MLLRKGKKQTVTAKPEAESSKGVGKKIFSRPALIVLALVAVAFLIYSMVTIINIRSRIKERRQELNDIQSKITVQEIKNDEMQKLYDSTGTDFSTLAEQIARDELDYVGEGERIFVNVSGD